MEKEQYVADFRDSYPLSLKIFLGYEETLSAPDKIIKVCQVVSIQCVSFTSPDLQRQPSTRKKKKKKIFTDHLSDEQIALDYSLLDLLYCLQYGATELQNERYKSKVG